MKNRETNQTVEVQECILNPKDQRRGHNNFVQTKTVIHLSISYKKRKQIKRGSGSILTKP